MIRTRAEAISEIRHYMEHDSLADAPSNEACHAAIDALRGPSREAVERVWLSAPDIRLEVEELEGGGTRYSAVNTCAACGQETPIGHFCHNCGAALDLTGVSLVMERLRGVMGP